MRGTANGLQAKLPAWKLGQHESVAQPQTVRGDAVAVESA